MVWLKARRDFTFKDTSYRDGEVFAVPPIVAVQMRALRSVDWSKAPEPKTRRRRKQSEPVPEPVIETVIETTETEPDEA